MPTMKPLDVSLPIQQQLGLEAAPVVLVNLFFVDETDEQAFLDIWQHDAAFMKRQPGFISTQLHRALGPKATYLNYAVWETNAHFKAAFTHPEFQSKIAQYPSSSVASPHLFKKIAVPGICVA